MPLYDGMLGYPKDVPYRRYRQRDMDQGDSSNVSALETSAHVGTHVDSPLHYFPDSYGVEAIPLDHLYGPAQVLDCRGLPAVTAEILQQRWDTSVPRVLLQTDNSTRLLNRPDGDYDPGFVYLDEAAAAYLVERDARLVAIDYLSIDKSGLAAKPSHHTLLAAGVVIVEGVNLAAITPGRYFLACGPLKMCGADGAPGRAVLIEGLGV